MATWLRSRRLDTLSGQQRHQARLIGLVLVLMAVYFAVIGTLNLIVFKDYNLAVMDYVGMVAVLSQLAYFRQSANLQLTAWLLVVTLASIMLYFIHQTGGLAYSVMWVTLLPPIAFFLLGRQAGAWICAIVFIYIVVFFYVQIPTMPAVQPSTGSLLNIAEVLLAHWLMFRLYERSRSEAYAELERLSETDKLTGIYNRSHLDDVLQQEITRHHRNGQPLTVVLCDIDHFKQINDKYGHLTGDIILQQLAQLLKGNMRGTDFCGRWGGEEFLIICPDTPATAATAIISKLQQSIREADMAEQIRLTLSFGIAMLQPGESADDQLRRADNALYEAKRLGRDRMILANDTESV
jgi:diguanylate cyclase